MTDHYQENSEFGADPRWSPEFVWSTLLALVIFGGVLLWAYLDPRPISPSFRATEIPVGLSGG
jgi:hypothetical protein